MQALNNRYLATLLLSMTAKAAMGDRLVDPTQPAYARPTNTSETLPAVRVEAILQSGERRLAIVNGKVVRAGDRLGAIQILEVSTDGVRYSRGGETNVARLTGKPMQVRHNVERRGEES
jgi:MSHA biogenesis protein MshK